MIPLLVALALAAGDPPLEIARDARGRIVRHRAPVAAFMREVPCPGGPDSGSIRRCRGWRVDHIIPLCAGGEDASRNMQWQDQRAAAQKDVLELAICRRGMRLR